MGKRKNGGRKERKEVIIVILMMTTFKMTIMTIMTIIIKVTIYAITRQSIGWHGITDDSLLRHLHGHCRHPDGYQAYRGNGPLGHLGVHVSDVLDRGVL
jgi:hypothetical protein